MPWDYDDNKIIENLLSYNWNVFWKKEVAPILHFWVKKKLLKFKFEFG